jgi:hypothetical protein
LEGIQETGSENKTGRGSRSQEAQSDQADQKGPPATCLTNALTDID